MRKIRVIFGMCCLTMALLVTACVAPEPGGEPAEQLPVERATDDTQETDSPAQVREELTEPDTTPTVGPRGETLPKLVPPPEKSVITGEAPQELLDAIVADLVERTGAAPTAIEVLQAEAVIWHDGSLGCPQPGMMYTQALVNGYRVVLSHDGQAFDYRAGNRGFFFLCERPLPLRVSPPGGGNGESPDQ